MSKEIIDSLLDSLSSEFTTASEVVDPVVILEPGEIDPRIRNLSYSGLLNLHSCPRRFQLEKLSGRVDNEDIDSGITFAFGHAVGLGIQYVFEGRSEQEIFFSLFTQWDMDIFDYNPKQNKSLWLAIGAIQSFIAMRKCGFLKDWELVYVDGNPATELSFRIALPNGFYYRGFVDAVLRNKLTGKVMVLECKTTSSTNLSPAMYKNSAQAIGYSVVLDNLFSDLSSYEVLYLIYVTKDMTYEQYTFAKSYLQRALWIQELLLDVEVVKLYEATEVYPMHGESCYSFFRECDFYQSCTLATEHMAKPLTEKTLAALKEKEAKYQIEVTVQDLIESQLRRGELL